MPDDPAHGTPPHDLSPPALHLVAVGLIAGDLTPLAIARYAGVPVSVATEAIEEARGVGLISADDSIDDLTRARLIAELGREMQAHVHAAVARHLFAAGPDLLPQAIRHIRAAGTLGPAEPMVALADQGGRLSLSLGHYQAAYDLLFLADELDSSNDLSAQGRRLCHLATATDGLGRVEEARQHLARAVGLGELAHDAGLVARAAVMHTLPVDWYAGNPRTAAFLQRASAMPQETNAEVSLRAARALAEIRIPVTSSDGQQWAWVTRPAVAQPLAEQALADSASCHPKVQCLALLAWRTTHRSPALLDRRRDISTRGLDLAQQLRLPTLQVEGAVWLAVDAIESGDRGLYDEALSVARWVSHTDGNPRLKWRAATLTLGAALLDDDLEAAERLRHEVRHLSEGTFSPGSYAIEMFFLGQELISRDRPEEMVAVRFDDDDMPGIANPVARAAVGFVWARTGEPEVGVQFARRAIRQLDAESSYLLVATRLAAVAHAANDDDLAREVVDLLTPWSRHVSVDGNGWWCDGPVSLWLAMLHHQLGDTASSLRYLDLGETTARSLNDVRSLRRAALLRAQLPHHSAVDTSAADLTERELAVLAMLATGATNPTIARTLAYSLSTIRNDTIAIYKKLGVTGRPDAVAKALAMGLLNSPH